MNHFIDALLFRANYNTTVVCLGAIMLGAAAGALGTFILLRRRSLASDAVGHATLPGLTAVFIIMALLTGDGRWMPGLMLGAAGSAALGLWCLHLLVSRTRLQQDAAIAAVLSTFFGFGVVLLTVVQSLGTGRPAGLNAYLLGSAAGMLRHEAELIAVLSLATGTIIYMLRRPLTSLCFDGQHASIAGIPVQLLDLAISGLLLATVVTSLKIVGLVLSVALCIIPAVAARFWTNRVTAMVLVSAAFGATGSHIGAALSSTAHSLPTGAIITLSLFILFLISMLAAPSGGLIAMALRHRHYQQQVHIRQGLLALEKQQHICSPETLRLLRKAGWVHANGLTTAAGALAARGARRDENLWALYRRLYPDHAAHLQQPHIQPLHTYLPAAQFREFEQRYRQASAEQNPVGSMPHIPTTA
ncbi:metal ABC transporter permease [Alcaligenaceae bacterium]|nr:metal ABC transporter permease [Alcaligenaceae bacterium]